MFVLNLSWLRKWVFLRDRFLTNAGFFVVDYLLRHEQRLSKRSLLPSTKGYASTCSESNLQSHSKSNAGGSTGFIGKEVELSTEELIFFEIENAERID